MYSVMVALRRWRSDMTETISHSDFSLPHHNRVFKIDGE
jgi:hypothetical protein